MEDDSPSAAKALNSIIGILNGLDDEARRRILKAVITFFQLELEPPQDGPRYDHRAIDERTNRPSFSTNAAPTPKEFLLEKQPKTDVERIACLAYYLTHYRETPSFKTLDLAKLNTEAAQPKFSNTAYSVANATN